MKPVDFRFKNKPSSRLFLLLCLVGVALVAWWAWAAGPIRTKSAIQPTQKAQAQPILSTPGYTSAQSVSPNNSISSSPVSGSNGAPSYMLPPDSTQPSPHFCYPISGIQPDIAQPCGCGGQTSYYPCCISHPGIEIMCPATEY